MTDNNDSARFAALPTPDRKLVTWLAAIALFAQGRLAPLILAAGIGDLLWCAAFFMAFQRTRVEPAVAAS